MSLPIFLKIYEGTRLKKVQQLNESPISLGSDTGVQVPLEGAAPWHSMIEDRGGSFVLVDLGSDAGTLLNGQKIVEQELNSGDRIQIGKMKIEFFIGQPFVQGSKKAAVKKSAPKPSSSPAPEPEAPSEPEPEPEPEPESEPEAAPPPAQAAPKKPSKKWKAAKKQTAAPARVKAPPQPQAPLVHQPPSKDVQKLWKSLAPLKASKKTLAPPSAIKNLDKTLSPGTGGAVEVLVAWKERIIAVRHYSKKNKTVTIGSNPASDIPVPNLSGQGSYPLIQIGAVAQINISKGMTGKILRQKGKEEVDFESAVKKNVITPGPGGGLVLPLGQGEVVRVNFHPMLSVYVRYSSPGPKAPGVPLFDFTESELIGIGLAGCLFLMLFFFTMIYYPQYLLDEEKLEERKIRVATVQFKPPPRKKPLRIEVKKREMKRARNIPVQAKKKVQPKKPMQVKKKGRLGRAGAVGAKKKAKSKKKTMTSARPGRSLPAKTKRPSAGAKSPPKKDPSQVGLLGAFGKGGLQKQLDKAYTGSGTLGGLADKATGRSGSKEVYSGEGIGTKFKDAGAGGKGPNLVGISGISTKGKGGGVQGFGRGGGLGSKGSVNLSFGISEMDVEGTVDREAIKRVVLSNKPQLARCHSRVLQQNPDIRGRILIEWTIEGSRVTGASIKSNNSASRELANCVMSRLKTWRFPGAIPKGGIGVVTFPFFFVSS